MTSLQETIIKTLHVQPKIDPATEIERRVDFLASFLKKTGMKTLVLGISGGQDSSLAGRLSQWKSFVKKLAIRDTNLLRSGCHMVNKRTNLMR